ncbi:MAG: ABC transporter permease [Blautia marasmi]
MQSSKNKKNIQWDKYMVYIIFTAVFILFALILGNKGFLQPRNLINILRQTAMISVMAVAGVFVMAAGQIDLTVGAVTAMTAMLVSLVLQATNSILLALVTGLGFGVVIGCINGLLVTKLKLPAFLATLGVMEIVRGAAMWITNTAAVPIANKTFCNILGSEALRESRCWFCGRSCFISLEF